MKYRRGFLLAEETLKIIIAVICLLFLAYLLISIYLNNKTDEELELAKASLEHLVEEINVGNPTVEIYNPDRNWIIVGWPVDGELPKDCSNLGWVNCLCICKQSWFFSILNSQNIKEFCEDKGTCKELSQKIVAENKGDFYIPIENPPLILNIDYTNGAITTK